MSGIQKKNLRNLSLGVFLAFGFFDFGFGDFGFFVFDVFAFLAEFCDLGELIVSPIPWPMSPRLSAKSPRFSTEKRRLVIY